MERIALQKIVKRFEIEDIEKHIVHHFLMSNSISFRGSEYISSYMDDFSVNPELLKLVEALGHNTIEEVAVDMELLIPEDDKKLNGAFFTPSYIADYILYEIQPEEDARIIDPSCGSGAFLLAIVRYMRSKYEKSIKRCIKENVYGADILKYNIKRCKILLSLLALMNGEYISESDMNLWCCDSLKFLFPHKFDAVVGNPPYVKFQDMEVVTREYLAETFQTTTGGAYNLYFAFFELGLKLLQPKGQLGYITPNNYFTSLAGRILRSFFQRTQSIYKIVDFGAVMIFDVQTYTAVTFLSPDKQDSILYGRIGETDMPQQYLTHIPLTSNPYSELSTEKWRLFSGKDRENIYNIEHIGEPIGHLFDICVGLATLKDEVFFVLPTRVDDSFYYIQRGEKEYAIEKSIAKPVVKISDIKKNSDIETNKRYIIYPYSLSNGKAKVIPEEEFAIKYPQCYQYLLTVKDILKSRGKGRHKYTPFYSYGRTQGLNKYGIKLLTPTFSRYPRFMIDSNKERFFTNGYAIYYKSEGIDLFSSKVITRVENIDVTQKILNSIVMRYYIKKTSISIQGGYPCFQKNFIERFSIPDLTEDDVQIMRKLSKQEELDTFLIEKYSLKVEDYRQICLDR
jgi:hypothetical protein